MTTTGVPVSILSPIGRAAETMERIRQQARQFVADNYREPGVTTYRLVESAMLIGALVEAGMEMECSDGNN